MSSVSKSKYLESAQKQISKGNLDKALKDYQKILKLDPSDTSVRLKTGDLCERMGDRAQALAEYRRVASTFTSQGFYSKAVAVLKRIQKADPDQIEIHLELAELNEKLGLLSEVVHHYQLAANVHDRKGEKRAAIDILKKVSEVGQSNLERKVKVAELYFKEGFPEAGYEQFIHATSDLDEQSPDLVEIAVRMCKASPEDTRLIQHLGEIHLTQGDPKRAIEIFEQAREIAVQPRTLELMAKAKLQIELPGEARTLFEKAAVLYESSGEKGRARDANARATELAEQALDAPLAELPPTDEEGSVGVSQEESEAEESETTDGGLEVTLTSAPAPVAAAPASDDDLTEDERLEVAFSEAEVYRKYGKIEGAARVLEEVAKRFPQRHEPRIRLKDLYEAAGNWAKVADQCRMLGLIASGRGDDLRSSRFLEEAKRALARLTGERVKNALDAGTEDAEPEQQETSLPLSNPAEAYDPSADIIIDDERLYVDLPDTPPADGPTPSENPIEAVEDMLIRSDAFGGEQPDIPGSGEMAAGASGEPDDAFLDLELVIDDGGANPAGTPLAEETGAGADAVPELPLEPLYPEPSAEEVEEEIDAPGDAAAESFEDEGGTPVEEAAEETAEPTVDEESGAPLEKPAGEIDLRSAERLASRGDVAEAAALYARAVEAWPDDPTVRARHESLIARLSPPEPFAQDQEEDEEEEEEEEEEAIVLLDEVEDEPADEPPTWDWASTDGRLSTSNEIIGKQLTGPDESAEAAEPAEDEQNEFDLRAELEEDSGEADPIGDISDATQALSDLVTELQREEESAAATLDAQTHYDLGVAYKEMGLLEEAIRELSIAAKDQARRVECCEVIGICYRVQGRPEEAVRMLEECLGDGSIAAEGAPGLLYEMAVAQEAMGNFGKALDWYERVSQIDPDFSDVIARIAMLRETDGDGTPLRAPGNPLEGEGTDDIEGMLDDLETDD